MTRQILCMAALAGSLMAASIAAAADPSLNPRYRVETTLGDFVLELDGEKAPISTDNFNQYVEADFYDGTTFHRIIPGFMIQGGGFNAEYKQKKEKEGLRPGIVNEWRNGLKNTRGTISMARLGGQANSATSQFFINVVDNASLDAAADGAAYAVFGKVVEGMETVDKIRDVPTGPNRALPGYGTAVPKEPVIINDVVIVTPLDKGAIAATIEKSKAQMEAAEKQAAEERAARAKAAEEARLAAEQAKAGAEQEVIARLEAEHKGTFTTTASGLKYMHVTEGTGASPKASNTVEVHYRGTLLNGTEFDSSYSRNKTIEFPLGGVIRGWTEGLQLMKEGGRTFFVIPADLAYGNRATGSIPANSTLVFEVELFKVK